jgi:hypothetical protein
MFVQHCQLEKFELGRTVFVGDCVRPLILWCDSFMRFIRVLVLMVAIGCSRTSPQANPSPFTSLATHFKIRLPDSASREPLPVANVRLFVSPNGIAFAEDSLPVVIFVGDFGTDPAEWGVDIKGIQALGDGLLPICLPHKETALVYADRATPYRRLTEVLSAMAWAGCTQLVLLRQGRTGKSPFTGGLRRDRCELKMRPVRVRSNRRPARSKDRHRQTVGRFGRRSKLGISISV